MGIPEPQIDIDSIIKQSLEDFGFEYKGRFEVKEYKDINLIVCKTILFAFTTLTLITLIL